MANSRDRATGRGRNIKSYAGIPRHVMRSADFKELGFSTVFSRP